MTKIKILPLSSLKELRKSLRICEDSRDEILNQNLANSKPDYQISSRYVHRIAMVGLVDDQCVNKDFLFPACTCPCKVTQDKTDTDETSNRVSPFTLVGYKV